MQHNRLQSDNCHNGCMQAQNQSCHRFPEHQRGVAMVLAAAFIFAGIIALALAVDVGRLYAAQNRLQKAADMAALTAARYVGGCRALPGNSGILAIASNTAASNYNGDQAAQISVTLKTGAVSGNGRVRHFDANASGHPYAVVVTATDAGFQPLFLGLLGGAQSLHATAGAINRPLAEISMGTTLAGVNPQLLAQLLPINIGAAQQGDLAHVPIALGQLLDINADVITRQQLLNTSINKALGNISAVVSGQVAGLVDQIANLLPADPDQASLLDILSIAGNVGSQVTVNAGNIVNAAALLVASQRNTAVTIPLNLDVPGIANVSVSLQVLQPPVTAIGPPGKNANGDYFTQARTAQVDLRLNVSLLDLPGLSLLSLPLVVEGARGTAGLARIDCASAAQPFHHVVIAAHGSGLRAGVGTLQDINGDGRPQFVPGEATIAKILGIAVLSVKGTASVASSNARLTFDIDAPSKQLPVSQPIGGTLTTQQLLGNINLTPNLLGFIPLPLGQLLAPIRALLAGPLASALDGLLSQLGVSLGTGEVQLLSISVQQPQLFCDSRSACLASGTGS